MSHSEILGAPNNTIEIEQNKTANWTAIDQARKAAVPTNLKICLLHGHDSMMGR